MDRFYLCVWLSVFILCGFYQRASNPGFIFQFFDLVFFFLSIASSFFWSPAIFCCCLLLATFAAALFSGWTCFLLRNSQERIYPQILGSYPSSPRPNTFALPTPEYADALELALCSADSDILHPPYTTWWGPDVAGSSHQPVPHPVEKTTTFIGTSGFAATLADHI